MRTGAAYTRYGSEYPIEIRRDPITGALALFWHGNQLTRHGRRWSYTKLLATELTTTDPNEPQAVPKNAP